MTKDDFPTLVTKDERFTDVLGLAWHPSSDLLFTAKTHTWPLTPLAARSFRRLCDSLVLQYPGLLRQRGQPEDLTLHPASLDVWRLTPAASGYDLSWNPAADAHLLVGQVWSTAEATALARRVLQDSTVQFEAHDWLDHPVALWRGHALPTPHSAKRFLAAGVRSASHREATARAQRWHTEHGPIASALDTLTWKGIASMPGSTAAQRLLLHRLKGGRLTRWDTTHNRVGCPHCPLAEAAGGKMRHVFWDCARAKQLWTNLSAAWNHVWSSERGAQLHEIFSLRLRAIPDHLWSHPEVARLGKPTTDDTISVHLATQEAWRQQVLHTLQAIWRWRHSGADGESWTPAHATAYQDSSLRSALQCLQWARLPHSSANRFTDGAVRALASGVAPSASATQPAAKQRDRHVLFFDGGSRGNPGPGGADAVIVRVPRNGTESQIIWSASMALGAATTTNNTAEYTSLLTGLTAVAVNRWHPLHVVGDSQFILNQMRSYRAPNKATLRESYARSRRHADALGVQQWIHHPRAFNCMADAAANIAMDTKRSVQLRHRTTNPAHARLADHLTSDLAYWLDRE